MSRILVTGAGGFIGRHLVQRLKRDGHFVRAVGGGRLALPVDADERRAADLRELACAEYYARGIDEVYHLAANMGGIGYLSGADSQMMRDNLLLDTSVLEGARMAGVKHFLYASSACVYPSSLCDGRALREEDAIPASPATAYGWGKLVGERLALKYASDYAIAVRVARLHTIYGPGEDFGDRGKVIGSLCRKVAEAQDGGTIEVWGNGTQRRTFCFVSDAVDALVLLMASDAEAARVVNVGGERLFSVQDVAKLVALAAGKKLDAFYDHTKPTGADARGCDVTRMYSLGWDPLITLANGIAATYQTVRAQLGERAR